jgi:hypothetical protein
VNVKLVLYPTPQTFTTFAIFAKFAKFAKFATFNPAQEHPTPLHRHAPPLRSISERAVPPQNPPLPARRERGAGG